MATTIAHARTAIYESLTTDRTADRYRALAVAGLFRRGLPRGAPFDIRSREAMEGKTVFVGISDMSPAPGITELHSEHLFMMTFAVSCDYYLGYEVGPPADLDDLMAETVDDVAKVTAALCGGQLRTTVAGNETGLASDSLRRDGSQARILIDKVGEGRDRLLNVTTLFGAAFDFTPDA